MGYIARETRGAADGPLIFTFHGTGGDENQFHGFAEQLVPGAHVVSPRGDVSEMGANRFFRRKAEGVYDMDDLHARAQAMTAFLSDHVDRAGAKRVIALGYSNGANIAAAVAFDRPDLFTDLILMHPLIPWTPADQPGLSGVRVLVTAGERDPICPAPMTADLVAWLSAQGADLQTLWHPGGHEIVKAEIDAIRKFVG